jgi:hypothetical protein
MPTGTISAVNLTLRRGSVTCQGRADLTFTEADLVDVPLGKELRGKRVTYNEQGGRAERVRLAK